MNCCFLILIWHCICRPIAFRILSLVLFLFKNFTLGRNNSFSLSLICGLTFLFPPRKQICSAGSIVILIFWIFLKLSLTPLGTLFIDYLLISLWNSIAVCANGNDYFCAQILGPKGTAIVETIPAFSNNFLLKARDSENMLVSDNAPIFPKSFAHFICVQFWKKVYFFSPYREKRAVVKFFMQKYYLHAQVSFYID